MCFWAHPSQDLVLFKTLTTYNFVFVEPTNLRLYLRMKSIWTCYFILLGICLHWQHWSIIVNVIYNWTILWNFIINFCCWNIFRDGGSGLAGWAYAHTHFGRIEGVTRQRWHAALLLAHSDFQTLCHPWSELFCPYLKRSLYSLINQ